MSRDLVSGYEGAEYESEAERVRWLFIEMQKSALLRCGPAPETSPIKLQFNPHYCDQVEAALREKDLKNDKRHQRKKMCHTEQREVLQYFRMEGAQRQMVAQQKSKVKPCPLPTLDKQSPPPPYKLLEKGQFPIGEVDGTITGTLEVELRENEKPEYHKTKAQVHRSRERYRQNSREQTTSEDEELPVYQKRVCNQRSHSEVDLNRSPDPESVTEDLDGELEADSEMSITSEEEEKGETRKPQGGGTAGQRRHLVSVCHSSPADQSNKKESEKLQRLMEQYEEEER